MFLLSEPFLAFLDVLVEQKRHVMDDEGEHDFRKKFRGAPELHFQRSSYIRWERCIQWSYGLTRNRLRVFVKDLGLVEELR